MNTKINYFFILWLFAFINIYAQEINDSTYFEAKLKYGSEYYHSVNDYEANKSEKTKNSKNVLIYSIHDKYSLFEGYIDGKVAHFRPSTLEWINDEHRRYIVNNKGDKDLRKKYLLDLYNLKEKNKINNYKKIGLVITENRYFLNNSSSIVYLFKMFNGFDKIIKYVDISLTPFNRVGDITADSNKLQIIGPIEPNQYFSSGFEDVFYDKNKIIDKIEITKVKITFMDGSIKEIKDISKNIIIE